jgi:hypothetical protein
VRWAPWGSFGRGAAEQQEEHDVTAQEPGSVPDAVAPPNTFSYIAITCGVLAFVISWLIFGGLGIALSLVARGRGEQRWKIGLGVTLLGMVFGVISVALLND